MKRLTLLAALVVAAVQFAGPVALAAPTPPPAADARSTKFTVLPAIKSFPILYQGKTYYTDAQGAVALPKSAPGLDNRVRLQLTAFPLAGGGAARFEKFYGLGTAKTTAALAIFEPVSFSFANIQKTSVPGARLGEITVKSSTGLVTTLPATATQLPLQSSRVVPDNSGLEVKELYYPVRHVDVEGNNVVNRSQVQFFPTTHHQVDATVRARDAIFGFGVGGKLVLAYPNGHSVTKKDGSGGLVSLPGLPRGQYHMSIVGPGLKIVQPVAMSRPQNVDLKVFAWLDIVTVIVFALGVAAGLILLGGRFQQRRCAPEPAALVTETEAPVAEKEPAVVVAAAEPEPSVASTAETVLPLGLEDEEQEHAYEDLLVTGEGLPAPPPRPHVNLAPLPAVVDVTDPPAAIEVDAPWSRTMSMASEPFVTHWNAPDHAEATAVSSDSAPGGWA